MRSHRVLGRFALALLTIGAVGLLETGSIQANQPMLFGRPVRLDRKGRLASWSTQDSPYAHVVALAWKALETKFPIQGNGVETWLAYSRFDPQTFEGIAWPHNPASFYAMLTDSALHWYAFSGDAAAAGIARKALAFQLAHGTTPSGWNWARVPFASAAAGAVEYGGADDAWCDRCGRGDGIGVIEPDKIGELGFAYLQMYEMTREAAFRDGALACADALAKHVRVGSETSSPWPFRVYAETDEIREDYSSNVVGALMLFDELARLNLGNVPAYRHAREVAFRWLLRVPLANDAWSGYFEDVDIHSDVTANPNQYSALRTARWLIANRGEDPSWREHVRHLLLWTAGRFGRDTDRERGDQWGATVLSEQGDDNAKMASHTARFGATMALWYQVSGDSVARERAACSLNWATYACGDDGIVAVAENPNEGWWFSDGYGDFIRHFLDAMAAVPDWAPRFEDHLLTSTSVVTHIEYGTERVTWSDFDADASDTLRLTFRPRSVRTDGIALSRRSTLDGEGYTERPLESGGILVRVRHRVGSDVVVSGRIRD